MLEHHAVSAEAKARARRLTPSDDFGEVNRLLDETDAARKMIMLRGSPAFGGVRDVGEALSRAERGGMAQHAGASRHRGASHECAPRARIIIRRTRRGRSRQALPLPAPEPLSGGEDHDRDPRRKRDRRRGLARARGNSPPQARGGGQGPPDPAAHHSSPSYRNVCRTR